MNRVRMVIGFPENYDEDAIDALVEENFPEADLWYREKEIRFCGLAERSQELLRAVETICEHSSVRLVSLDNR